MYLVPIPHIPTCSIVVSAGVAVFTLIVHRHSIGISVGAGMVDAARIVARCIVLGCVLLLVDGSIN